MQRYHLSKKVTKQINTMFPCADLSKNTKIEYIKDDDLELILIEGTPSFFYLNKKIHPTLKFIHGKENDFKKITVDMGAVKYVCSGADIMRPGIIKIDENILKDDTVIIIDEKNNKALAVGIALEDAETMNSAKQGKAIKNIHWVGDKIWNHTI